MKAIRADVAAGTTQRVYEISSNTPSKLSTRDKRNHPESVAQIQNAKNSIDGRLQDVSIEAPNFPENEQTRFNQIIDHLSSSAHLFTPKNSKHSAEQLSALASSLGVPADYINDLAKNAAARKILSLGLNKPSIDYKKWVAKDEPGTKMDGKHTAEALVLRILVKDNPAPYTKTRDQLGEWKLFEYHFPDLGRVFVCVRGKNDSESVIVKLLIGKHEKGEANSWARRHLASCQEILKNKNLL